MNPIRLVEPGHSDEIELSDDVRAFVVRGTQPGPTVWLWAPQGSASPSMAQALGELRDALSARELRGAVGLLLDGPLPPAAREQYPWRAAIGSICEQAQAVVLFASMLPGYLAAPHVAVDLADRASRTVARALGAPYVTPHFVTPAPDPAVVTAPSATWLDGEAERLERPVIDRAVAAMRSLLATLGVFDGARAHPAVRVVVKATAEVAAPLPGLVEPVVVPGGLVRLGELAAWAGPPGARERHALRAPATGVVLWVRAGQLLGGPVVGIGKLRRALPSVMRAHKTFDALASKNDASASNSQPVEIGWCERVSLPALGIERLKAKIDTGARTCALHVQAMHEAAPGRWEIELGAGKHKKLTVDVKEFSTVVDSRGRVERRPVIETALELGGIARKVRISLTHRGDLTFPMLIGRTALGPEFRIHPSKRFLLR